MQLENDHPNILKLCDVYEEPQCWYVVLEYCDGGNLTNAFKRSPNFQTIKRIFDQCLSSIAYLHAKGLMHRDLKNENFVLTSKDFATCEVKMIDFSFATHYQKVEHGKVVPVINNEYLGTQLYMAPEVCVRCALRVHHHGIGYREDR